VSETATKTLAGVGVLTLTVATILWRAFVFTRLWFWFVAPLGMPELGIPHALGIMLAIGFLRPALEKVPDKTSKERAAELCGRATVAALALTVGWVIWGTMP
jgi:hypothetical protein